MPPPLAPGLAALIDTYDKTGRRHEAERYLRTFIQTHPENPTAPTLLDRLASTATGR
jgi:hypothetical protein